MLPAAFGCERHVNVGDSTRDAQRGGSGTEPPLEVLSRVGDEATNLWVPDSGI